MRIAILTLFLASLGFSQTAQYPSSVVTDNQLMVARNRVQSTLTGTLTSATTSFTVASGTGFIANMLVSIDNEILVVCSVVANNLTIGKASCPNTDGRGFDLTSPASHTSGTLIAAYVDAWHTNALSAEVKAIEGALGANLSNVISAGPQLANRIYGGPASGSSTNPTFRLLVAADIPANSSNTSGTAAGFTGNLAGDITGPQGATVVSRIGGIIPAASATIDATNASNILAGTLPPARLPLPTTLTPGGMRAINCTAGGQFVQVLGTDTIPICGTPAGGGNVSGPGTVTNGFIPQWGNSNNLLTTGLGVSATATANTVVESDSGGKISNAWLPAFTGDATSSAGTSALTLATVNGSPGACGDATHVCAITTNGKGLITAQTATAITGAAFGNQTANFAFMGPVSGAAAAPAFRALVSLDIPNNAANTSGNAGGLTGFTFSGPATKILVGTGSFVNGNCLATGASGNVVDNGSVCGSGGGGGTVTSVALTLPAEITVTGSPITTTGTLAGAWATQTANKVFASAVSGGAATPAFRALVAADIPTGYLYSNLSGAPTLPISIANGGSGQTTAAAAFDALSGMTLLGDTIYGGASGTRTVLPGNTLAAKRFKVQTGNGSVSAAPAWGTIVAGDLPATSVNSVVNDTNVTGSVSAQALTLGWTGTLAAGRLNTNVVQAVTNDTNLNGSISAQNLTLAWAGQLGITRGGTGQATASAAFEALSPLTTIGDTLAAGASGVDQRVAGNTTATKKFYTETGDGVNAPVPGWNTLVSGDIPNNAASTSGNAATATALAALPSSCTIGNYARGIDVNGNATNCTAAGGGGGSGTVTSVALTMPGIFTVSGSPISTSGTFAVGANGISGGIPYFLGSTVLASSNLLNLNLPILGGGAGGAPTSGSRSGNTTTFATTSGSLTSGHGVQIDASGNLVDTGGAAPVAFGGACNATVTSTAAQSTVASTCTLGATVILVYLDGSLLQSGSGNDYTVSGNNILIDGTSYPGGLTAGRKVRIVQ